MARGSTGRSGHRHGRGYNSSFFDGSSRSVNDVSNRLEITYAYWDVYSGPAMYQDIECSLLGWDVARFTAAW